MSKKVFLTLLVLFIGSKGFSQIIRINSLSHELDTTRWSGEVELGGKWTKNTRTILSYNLGSFVRLKTGKSNVISNNYLRTLNASSTNLIRNGFQHLRYQYALSNRLSSELFTQAQFDDILKIKLRWLSGGGAKFYLLKEHKRMASVNLLYMYEYEEVVESSDLYITHRASSNVETHFKFGDNSAGIIAYYQPSILDFTDYRLSGMAYVNLKVYKSLSYNISADVVYDSNPIPGIINFISNYKTGLRFRF